MPLPPAPVAPVSGLARFRGIVLVVLGALLFVVMCWLLVTMTPGMLNPGRVSDGGTTFTGTARQGLFGLGLFASVAIAGAVFFVAGVHLLRTGVIPRGIKRIGLALVVLIIFAGVMFMPG